MARRRTYSMKSGSGVVEVVRGGRDTGSRNSARAWDGTTEYSTYA